MTRIEIQVPEWVAAEVQKRADRRGLSTDGYVAEVICRDVTESSKKGWPEGFFERVAGRWQGDLVRPNQPQLEARDEF